MRILNFDLKYHLSFARLEMKVPREDALRMDRVRQGGRSDYSGIDDIESYAAHVVKFSLAGIHTIREEAEKRKKRIHRGIHENQ